MLIVGYDCRFWFPLFFDCEFVRIACLACMFGLYIFIVDCDCRFCVHCRLRLKVLVVYFSFRCYSDCRRNVHFGCSLVVVHG